METFQIESDQLTVSEFADIVLIESPIILETSQRNEEEILAEKLQIWLENE